MLVGIECAKTLAKIKATRKVLVLDTQTMQTHVFCATPEQFEIFCQNDMTTIFYDDANPNHATDVEPKA